LDLFGLHGLDRNGFLPGVLFRGRRGGISQTATGKHEPRGTDETDQGQYAFHGNRSCKKVLERERAGRRTPGLNEVVEQAASLFKLPHETRYLLLYLTEQPRALVSAVSGVLPSRAALTAASR